MKSAPDHLEFSFLSTRTGEMLIARNRIGLAAIMLADDQHSLMQALKARFPNAQTSLVNDGMHTEKMLINAIMQGEKTADTVSLDLQGTAFQLSVWHALMRIPFGATINYQQLAESVGKPSATRAVASACGANPLAVVVPCHRVIRKDGELGGYHWGLHIKRELLALEQQIKHRRQNVSVAWSSSERVRLV